jgi:hypothetical protein
MHHFDLLHKTFDTVGVMPFVHTVVQGSWAITATKIADTAKAPVDNKPVFIFGV